MLLLCAANLSAAPGGFILKESFSDRIVTTTTPGGTTCTKSAAGTLQLRIIHPGTIPTDSFNENTSVTINAGAFEVRKALGDDPNYEAGDTQARFRTIIVTLGGTRTMVLDALVTWKNGNPKVSVRAVTPNFFESAGASLFYTNGPVGTTSLDSAVVQLLFDSGTSTSFLQLSGEGFVTVTDKAKTSCNESFTLRKVKVKSAGTF
ncbi:MAG: hypothetical protein ACR2IE_03410 [Candidatus Sumerlaeaceae bacterium]